MRRGLFFATPPARSGHVAAAQGRDGRRVADLRALADTIVFCDPRHGFARRDLLSYVDRKLVGLHMLKPQEGAIMNHLKLVLFAAALALPVSSTQAVEWVDYDGTIPDNAVLTLKGGKRNTERPICRQSSGIGIVNEKGKCVSIKRPIREKKKCASIVDDGYQVLVDDSAADDAEGMHTQDEYDKLLTDFNALQEELASIPRPDEQHAWGHGNLSIFLPYTIFPRSDVVEERPTVGKIREGCRQLSHARDTNGWVLRWQCDFH